MKNNIISGELKKEKIYSVNQIAQTLDVSRSPVAGAVQTLSEEGLLRILPNQGFCIFKFSEKDIKNIFELRKAVEGYVVEKFIEINGDTSKIHTYLGAQKDYLKKTDVNLFLDADRKFHETLAKKIGNLRILETLQNIRDLVTLMNLEIMGEPKRGQQVIQEHTDILRAIDKKDNIATRKALYYHFDNTVYILTERIKKAKIASQ